MAAFRVKAGGFTTNTTTGPQTINCLGFEPTGILFHAHAVTTEGATADAILSAGMTDGTRSKTTGLKNNNAGCQSGRVQNSAQILSFLDDVANTVNYSATFTQFTDDGFIICNTANVEAGAYLIKYYAFGGTTNLKVDEVVVACSPVTTVGFQPNLLVGMSSGQGPGNLISTPGISSPIGFANRTGCPLVTNQWFLENYRGCSACTPVGSMIKTDGFTGQRFNNVRTWQASLSTFDMCGFTWAGTNADVMFYMAIELPACICSFIDTFAKSVGAAPATQTLPDSIFTPQGYMMATGAALSLCGTVVDDSNTSIGGYSGKNTASQWHTSSSREDCCDSVNMRTDDCFTLIEIDLGAVIDAAATPVAITDSTPCVTWCPNSARAIQIGYVAFENEDAFHITGTTLDKVGAVLACARVILFKHCGAAEACRVYSVVAHTNSDMCGVYDFRGLQDTDPRYLVMGYNITCPDVRGVTNDTLTPVAE